MRFRRLLVVAAAGLVACSSTSPAHRAGPPSPTGPTTGFASTQGCSDQGGAGLATIAWSQLHSPVLSYPDSGIRDIGVRLVGGTWHLYFTSVVGSAPDWRIATAMSRDLAGWGPPTIWPTQPGVVGVASPDVTRRPDGVYVVTYQSDPGETAPPGQDKLYYRTSSDLVQWSAPKRLMGDVHPKAGDRLIDAALAWTARGLILGYKFGTDDQHFEIAMSPSGSLDGPWTYVGRPNVVVNGGTIENYQFLPIDGVWHLLATSNNLDQPWLFTLQGDAAAPEGWLTWSSGRQLQVPTASWDHAAGIASVTFEPANSAYLCDARQVDGHFYLLYVGSNELHSYGGWGHTQLGVARSTDLINWQVPPT